jgi:predicted nicotinamide N-methyase
VAAGHLDPLRLPVLRDALARDGSPGALLAVALTYGGNAPTPEAMGPYADLLDDLRGAGLLSSGEPSIRLVPFAGMLVAADDASAGADAVMPPGGVTAELARLMPDCAGTRVLDVGGGPGTLALYAATEGAERAVSTDINARARAFVEANAALNGVQVEARTGDLFAPMGDDRFDIVVSQPPFLVHPHDVADVTYLHAGARGDDIALRILSDVGDNLEDGGVALVRFDVARDPHDVVDLVRAIDTHNRQTIVVWWPGPSTETLAVAYAAVQDPTLGRDYQRLATAYREHLLTFDLELERLTSALVVTRRVSEGYAPSFLVGFGTSSCPVQWDDLATALMTFELSMRSDDDLLAARVCPHPDLVVAERRTPGRPNAEVAAQLPHGALGWRASIEPDTVAFLDLVASTPEVADIVAAFGQGLDLDATTATSVVLPRLRDALQAGLLVAD